MSKIQRYISTGGLGDAFIASRKILKIYCNQSPLIPIEWLHIESNSIVPKLCEELFNPLFNYENPSILKFNINSSVTPVFECDPKYIENYRVGKWKDYIPISSGADGWCPLKGETKHNLDDRFQFIDWMPTEVDYDICLQVSAGAKNNRKWNFEPKYLKKVLKSYGKRVVLVGNDPKYEDEKDEYNLVCKLSLSNTLDVIGKSRMFIGLSGFLNYYSCAIRQNNIHWIESEEHEKRYYSPGWAKYTKGVKYGALQEILKVLNEQ